MCSILSMESAEVEVGFLQVQRTLIDFASQMESLNRMPNEKSNDNNKLSYPPLQMTKSEKELRMINRNRKAQDKRDEILAMQNVDIESSFASSKLPEEKRSVEK